MWRKKPQLRDLPKDKRPALEQLADYPRMTRWFDPVLLCKLLWRAIVSDLFGQYADRRLIEAALDTVSDDELRKRDDISARLAKNPNDPVWIDFVADLGDGFDATYAIAYLLAQQKLDIKAAEFHDKDEELPRGGALFMGGDEVYPTAKRAEYNAKLRAPYQFAFPDQKRATEHPPVFAIPGNHDWYDGLVNFLAFFTREKATKIGNWRTQQRRSYFAAKLTKNCWLWAIDIALVADMDQPQADYFVAIAEAMPQGANIILCSAEPGWYKTDSDSYRSLSYAAWIAENAGKALHIPLVLSGDTHHYSRYEAEDGTQYITSGGGGAFLHGTHQLPGGIRADWLRHRDELLSLKACHPPKEKSKQLLIGDLAFPFLNPGFAATLGLFYGTMGYWLSLFCRLDLAAIFFCIFAFGFVSYSTYQEKVRNFRTVGFPIVHAAAHFLAMVCMTWLWVCIDSAAFDWRQHAPWWIWVLAFNVLMIVFGGLVAGFIFGFNLLVACRFADMHHNDAFSAMRLDSYRHFIRIRIVGDQITVYPVGIDKIPKRHEWRPNKAADTDPTASYFVPPDKAEYRPKLLEPPIVISGARVRPTTDVKKPSELPNDD